jgi:hypothetical protein
MEGLKVKIKCAGLDEESFKVAWSTPGSKRGGSSRSLAPWNDLCILIDKVKLVSASQLAVLKYKEEAVAETAAAHRRRPQRRRRRRTRRRQKMAGDRFQEATARSTASTNYSIFTTPLSLATPEMWNQMCLFRSSKTETTRQPSWAST